MAETRELPPPSEEAAEMERYVRETREATESAYQLLRRGAPAASRMAAALPSYLEALYHTGRGADAARFVDQLLETLRSGAAGREDAFAEGVRLGFAAGCLVQWRVLEYLAGEEMPLWPVQHYSSDRQVD
ncbi:MAG TPA: hypothetical protein GX715_02970 [Armatimonadetes bacterium]|jgi:hypothetical protein|nr:hypothetical protein [Armatimonadota bacterium]